MVTVVAAITTVAVSLAQGDNSDSTALSLAFLES